MKARAHTAKSIGDLLYQKLSGQSLRGEVHSVFQNVINILLNGNLYTLGKTKVGNGPCTILLPNIAETLDEWGCVPGTPVKIVEGVLQMGGVQIGLGEADLWKSEWKGKPSVEHMLNLLPQLKGLVLREGNLRGLGFVLLDEAEQEEERVIDYTQQVLVEQAVPLIEELRRSMQHNPKQFWASLLDFVGLGPGLTPAGDDFIMGFILTLRYLEWGGQLHLPEIDFEIVREQVKQDTNLISATGVLLALEGRPIELIGDVIENIFQGNKVNTTLNALRLMDRGSTSGTDTITGIIVAGELLEKKDHIHWSYYT